MEPAGPRVVEVQEGLCEIDVPPGKIPYFVTLICGLEQIAADELQEVIPEAEILGATRGKLFFCCQEEPRPCLEMRTIENVFGFVDQRSDLPGATEGLEMLEAWMRGLDIEPAIALHHQLHGTPTHPSFRITARRAGEHDYNSLEIAAATGAAVERHYGWDVDLEDYDYDIRVYVSDDTVVVGVRLTVEPLHRRARVKHTSASLNPTVAHAMCRLTAPATGEVVVDPMCGAGTILVERARCNTPGLLLGGDLFAKPLEAAAANIDAADIDAKLVRWDARRLPLATASVDAVICNMPWGRRIGSHRINRHLYPAFIRELARVMRPGGRVALLTQEKRLITRVIRRTPGFETVREDHLSLSGTHPAIYLMHRLRHTAEQQ